MKPEIDKTKILCTACLNILAPSIIKIIKPNIKQILD